jgi:hypothetical protein
MSPLSTYAIQQVTHKQRLEGRKQNKGGRKTEKKNSQSGHP